MRYALRDNWQEKSGSRQASTVEPLQECKACRVHDWREPLDPTLPCAGYKKRQRSALVTGGEGEEGTSRLGSHSMAELESTAQEAVVAASRHRLHVFCRGRDGSWCRSG